MQKISSYEEWLELSEVEQEDLKLSWNTYERENIGIPYTAAGRLAISSKHQVLDVTVGTYHCGEYLIHATVPSSEHPSCPSPLSQRFEGFRVMWLPYEEPPPPPGWA
ncbi:MAG: hypothetical protein NWT08_00405 [Akkermansiaceae bacterium]|jgi:hypothetical protein|nr:hypothetical protein [Akkermansiaceae bacterium]MDP4648164.1 hypothetical protein [Akkermansiaceae bacterium]MDP4721167.1 hypothetical protein [Akkermansiaceae bacterium]MDP4778907.1 hypothetical protein [Akkermansiaceae bacterium]MDP4846891.1 hypothetical protein [Akkermansiaceae bacterium]